MNKLFGLLPLMLSATCGLSAQSFTKLTPITTNGAIAWSKNDASRLTADQVALFNAYFLLTSNPSENNVEPLMLCLRSIQEDPAAASAFEKYQANATEVIQAYINHMESKFATLKSTPEDSDTIMAKLEAKVYELFAYINSIYYNILNSYNTPATPAATEAATTEPDATA